MKTVTEEKNPSKQNAGINSVLRAHPVDISDAVMIEALGSVTDDYRYTAFKASAIEYISGLGKDNAQIVLYGGVTIPVAMDPRELRKKIFEPDLANLASTLDLTAVTGETVMLERAAPSKPEQKEDVVDQLETADRGALVKGQGIYLGIYALKDKDGVSLGKIFNVYAAPENLPGQDLNYEDTVNYIANLRLRHGHDGTKYKSDEEIHAALKDGSYKGGWIIPPREILCGKDRNGQSTTPDNLHDSRNKGEFISTFYIKNTSYWTSYAFSGRCEIYADYFVSER